jgi:DNA repair protein RadC
MKVDLRERSSRFVPEFSICLVRERRARFMAKSVSDSETCFKTFRSAFEGLDREHFAVICLDAKNNPIGFNVVAVGCLTMTIVHPREVFKCAVLQNAAAVILAHNHPSGDTTPSQEDRRITERLIDCAKILGIPVLDHLIFGNNGYLSFADEGWIYKAERRSAPGRR